MRHFETLHLAASGIGLLGALVIVLGVLMGAARFVRSEWAGLRGADIARARQELRQGLGYHLLLGLEFLIAADIIDTLMRPEPLELVVLGAIVLIRGVIGYSLHSELAREAKVGTHPMSS